MPRSVPMPPQPCVPGLACRALLPRAPASPQDQTFGSKGEAINTGTPLTSSPPIFQAHEEPGRPNDVASHARNWAPLGIKKIFEGKRINRLDKVDIWWGKKIWLLVSYTNTTLLWNVLPVSVAGSFWRVRPSLSRFCEWMELCAAH